MKWVLYVNIGCLLILPVRGDLGKALLAASEKNDIVRVAELIKEGANVNVLHGITGYTPIIHAVMCRNLEMVCLLVEAGADWRIRSRYYYRTTIEWAEYFSYTEIYEFLIRAAFLEDLKEHEREHDWVACFKFREGF